MAENKSSNAGAVVAAIAGLTAAAVGAYYLYGHKDADKNRAKVKSWMLKAKGEVLEHLENAGEVTESAYVSAVDTVAKKYNELKHINPGELSEFISEMKGHWNGIKKTMEKAPMRKAKAATAKAPVKSAKKNTPKSKK